MKNSILARFRRGAPRLVLFASLLLAAPALAEGAEHGESAHGESAHGESAHGESAHGESAHGEHGGHHVPTWDDVNWASGILGEKEGVEPTLLYRPVGMPIPVLALLVNSGILFFFIFRFGGPALRAGLSARRARIAGDIDAAARMVDEATLQLAHYESKLAEMSRETDRIKREMREQAEAERARILEDAKVHRAELEEDARRLVLQELAEARQKAIQSSVSAAIKSAAEGIARSMNDADHERLGTAALGTLESHLGRIATGSATKGASA